MTKNMASKHNVWCSRNFWSSDGADQRSAGRLSLSQVNGSLDGFQYHKAENFELLLNLKKNIKFLKQITVHVLIQGAL